MDVKQKSTPSEWESCKIIRQNRHECDKTEQAAGNAPKPYETQGKCQVEEEDAVRTVRGPKGVDAAWCTQGCRLVQVTSDMTPPTAKYLKDEDHSMNQIAEIPFYVMGGTGPKSGAGDHWRSLRLAGMGSSKVLDFRFDCGNSASAAGDAGAAGGVGAAGRSRPEVTSLAMLYADQHTLNQADIRMQSDALMPTRVYRAVHEFAGKSSHGKAPDKVGESWKRQQQARSMKLCTGQACGMYYFVKNNMTLVQRKPAYIKPAYTYVKHLRPFNTYKEKIYHTVSYGYGAPIDGVGFCTLPASGDNINWYYATPVMYSKLGNPCMPVEALRGWPKHDGAKQLCYRKKWQSLSVDMSEMNQPKRLHKMDAKTARLRSAHRPSVWRRDNT